MTKPKAMHFLDGEWVEGNPPIMGPMTHAAWMASVVFDGARAFEGVTPDLDRHCERLVRSAASFGLKPVHSAGEMEEICRDGLRHFAKDAALYLRPMLWAESGFVSADPERDSPKLTGDYAHAFHPDTLAATAPLPQLEAFARSLSLVFMKSPGSSGKPDDYTIDHSAALVVLDPQARMAGVVQPPFDAKGIAADLAALTGTAR